MMAMQMAQHSRCRPECRTGSEREQETRRGVGKTESWDLHTPAVGAGASSADLYCSNLKCI